MKLRILTTEEVYAKWDWMRAGLLVAAAKTEARLRPEDVYVRLRGGSAWAYVIEHDGVDVGFAVLTQEWDPDGLCVFIWALWSDAYALRGKESDVYAGLEDIARKAGAKRLRMQSPRKGWERESFFAKVASVYEHEVA